MLGEGGRGRREKMLLHKFRILPPLLNRGGGGRWQFDEIFNAAGRSFGSLECAVCTLGKKKNLC